MVSFRAPRTHVYGAYIWTIVAPNPDINKYPRNPVACVSVCVGRGGGEDYSQVPLHAFSQMKR